MKLNSLLAAAALVGGVTVGGGVSATTINFDTGLNLNNQVLGGYGGIANWSNLYVLDGVNYGTPNSYQNAVKSANNVAYPAYGNQVRISNPTAFTLNDGYFTAIWDNAIDLVFNGYSGGNLIHSLTTSVGKTSTDVVFNWAGIDTLVIDTFSHNTHNRTWFGLDNLTVNESVSNVPEPASLALLGLGLAGLAAARRRKSA